MAGFSAGFVAEHRRRNLFLRWDRHQQLYLSIISQSSTSKALGVSASRIFYNDDDGSGIASRPRVNAFAQKQSNVVCEKGYGSETFRALERQPSFTDAIYSTKRD